MNIELELFLRRGAAVRRVYERHARHTASEQELDEAFAVFMASLDNPVVLESLRGLLASVNEQLPEVDANPGELARESRLLRQSGLKPSEVGGLLDTLASSGTPDFEITVDDLRMRLEATHARTKEIIQESMDLPRHEKKAARRNALIRAACGLAAAGVLSVNHQYPGSEALSYMIGGVALARAVEHR